MHPMLQRLRWGLKNRLDRMTSQTLKGSKIDTSNQDHPLTALKESVQTFCVDQVDVLCQNELIASLRQTAVPPRSFENAVLGRCGTGVLSWARERQCCRHKESGCEREECGVHPEQKPNNSCIDRYAHQSRPGTKRQRSMNGYASIRKNVMLQSNNSKQQ